MKKLFLYIKYYMEPNERELGKLAFKSAKEYYSNKPLSRHPDARYTRTRDFQAYQQGFKNAYRSNYAKEKLSA